MATGGRRGEWTWVGVGYAAVLVFALWPLPLHLPTAIGGDFGDSTFVTWTLWWVQAHLLALLQGDGQAWTAMWNAPIFAPNDGALAYSEHFLAPAALTLPLFAATGNPILVYNVVLVATLWLAGFATHGLTRRLTGSHPAAAAAGVVSMLNEYRFAWTMAHLHAMANGWWIVGLWALDRVAATGSARAALAAAVALGLQGYSSNYLTAFTAPFTAAFVVWSLARHERLTDPRRWALVAAVAVANAVSLLPLVRRYLAMRDTLDFSWALDVVQGNSATVAAYVEAAPWLAPLCVLAIAGVLAPARFVGALSRPARLGLAMCALLAFALAMGPAITIGGRALPGPYQALQLVPGFAGLRVVHRFAVVGLVFVAVLSGAGTVWLSRSKVGAVAAMVAIALGTRTAWSTSFALDRPIGSEHHALPPNYLRPAVSPPDIYRHVAALPAETLVIELPFGDIPYEIRYTYFTAAHRRRLLNGYSGVLPADYLRRQRALAPPLTLNDATWAALAPATHAVVHSGAWSDDTGRRLGAWLESRGARLASDVDGARLYVLPPR